MFNKNMITNIYTAGLHVPSWPFVIATLLSLTVI